MAAQSEFELGEDVTLRGEFRTPAGVLQDPTGVFLTVKRPGGRSDTYTYGGGEITKDATGEYSAVVDADVAGWWNYRWYSTGTGKGAETGVFRVKPNPAE